jgi:peptide/nickel transport system permease protein
VVGFLFPGIAIVLSVLSFALLGDAIRDGLDPRKVRRENTGNLALHHKKLH